MPDDPINTLSCWMLENRSFDHMLGGLSTAISWFGWCTDGRHNRSNTDPDW